MEKKKRYGKTLKEQLLASARQAHQLRPMTPDPENPADPTDDGGNLFRWADQIQAPLWDDLRARSPEQAAACVGAAREGDVFKVRLLGVSYRVDPLQRRITQAEDSGRRVGYQTGIVLLTALARSMGVPPSNRMVAPEELQGGRMFFTGAHRLATRPLAAAFMRQPQELLDRARQIGAETVPGADCGLRLPGLPLLPLYVLLWRADDEFGPRAFIGIDDRALFHLDLAGVFALTNILVTRLAPEAGLL